MNFKTKIILLIVALFTFVSLSAFTYMSQPKDALDADITNIIEKELCQKDAYELRVCDKITYSI